MFNKAFKLQNGDFSLKPPFLFKRWLCVIKANQNNIDI